MPAPRRFIIRLMSLAALSLLPGCVSLTPYHEAVASLPGDRLVEVEGRRVHVEVTGSMMVWNRTRPPATENPN